MPPSSLAPRALSESQLAAASTATEPNFPAQSETAPATVASRSQTDLAAVQLSGVPVTANRFTDPSAQTMPDMRAVRSEAPPAIILPSVPAPAPSDRAVASVAPAAASPPSTEEREPSAGDPAAYDAIEDYDPGLSTTPRRTPVPASDMPPPPLAMLSKARPDGVYRSQATPPPPPDARAAMGSSPAARAAAASRPPVGAPASQSTRPQSRRSLFGEDLTAPVDFVKSIDFDRSGNVQFQYKGFDKNQVEAHAANIQDVSEKFLDALKRSQESQQWEPVNIEGLENWFSNEGLLVRPFILLDNGLDE